MMGALLLGICLTQLAANSQNNSEITIQNEQTNFSEIQSNQIEIPKEALDTALPEIETTRVLFLDSPKRRETWPYQVSIPELKLSCAAPCALDVPSGSEYTLIFDTKRGRLTQDNQVFSGSDLVLRLELEPLVARKAPGHVLIAIGSGWLAAGLITLAVMQWGVHPSSPGPNGETGAYTMASVRTRWITAGVGILPPILILGPLGVLLLKRAKWLEKKRTFIVRDVTPKSEATSSKATLQDSFQFGVLPTKDGFSAGAGFRF